jgi:hypothetical protein
VFNVSDDLDSTTFVDPVKEIEKLAKKTGEKQKSNILLISAIDLPNFSTVKLKKKHCWLIVKDLNLIQDYSVFVGTVKFLFTLIHLCLFYCRMCFDRLKKMVANYG